MSQIPKSAVIAAVVALFLCLGCQSEEASRVPSAAEIKTANAKRFADIDKMPISDQQKALLKSEIEGHPIQNPGAMMAAGHGGTIQPGRRPQ